MEPTDTDDDRAGCDAGTHRPARRDDTAVVALEWLLIVAAIAGLAALAVVVVQHVTDDTAERARAQNARRTIAQLAARGVEQDSRTATAATWSRWENHFTATCRRIAILYSDTNITLDAAFRRPANHNPTDEPTKSLLAAGTEHDPTPTSPQIKCNIVDEPRARLAYRDTDPTVTIADARSAAAAIVANAKTLRPDDTWATWKAHFEQQCNELGITYAALNITVESHFNEPTNHDSHHKTTQQLLDAATPNPPAHDEPQTRCHINQ
ncbi:MAG: hypothetical protein OXG47_05285 [bacterium]|nr:hypothetical protein [bacterium]